MNETAPDQASVNLLWTGGWDSTYQLLRLLLIQRRRVTPFYLIDADRRSTGMELRTMKRIKASLLNEHPSTSNLLLPTRHFAVGDVSPDPKITRAFQSIRRDKYIGSQYDWLARYCKQAQISNMQLCIHRQDKAHAAIQQVVTKHNDHSEAVFRVDPSFAGTSEFTVFGYFQFPNFMISKRQMAAEIDEKDWNGVMYSTWFCHHPTAGLKPCGRCNPCRTTIEGGLGGRIPLGSRISSFFRSTCPLLAGCS